MPPLGDWILAGFGPPFSSKFDLTLTSHYRDGGLIRAFFEAKLRSCSAFGHAVALAILLDGLRMLRKVLPKVVGMSLSPLSLAIARHLAILRIRAQLLPMIIAAALPLALRLAADHLLRTINGRQERTLAVRTTAGLAQADSSVPR